jgi:methanogenic corrinoid protein MtbC1
MEQWQEVRAGFESALLALDRIEAGRLLAGLSGSSSAFHAIEAVVVPALEKIGSGWEAGSVALAQVYMSGRICEELVDEILPSQNLQRNHVPATAIATLEDSHSLGKRVVYSALRAGGFEVLDYGAGIGAEALAERVLADGVSILMVSTLMLRSALRVKVLTDLLKRSGFSGKVVVGGAPFRLDTGLWQEVGADAVGRNAMEALAIRRGFPSGHA